MVSDIFCLVFFFNRSFRFFSRFLVALKKKNECRKNVLFFTGIFSDFLNNSKKFLVDPENRKKFAAGPIF